MQTSLLGLPVRVRWAERTAPDLGVVVAVAMTGEADWQLLVRRIDGSMQSFSSGDLLLSEGR